MHICNETCQLTFSSERYFSWANDYFQTSTVEYAQDSADNTRLGMHSPTTQPAKQENEQTVESVEKLLNKNM